MANGLRVIADHGFADCPPSDALIVTGGPGWVAQMRKRGDPQLHAPLRGGARGRGRMHRRHDPGRLRACSNGCKATTKREIAGAEVPPVQIMRERHPLIDVTESASLVDCGRVVTGGGVTLGIDATLHLLARLLGEDVANETARIMEYSRAWRANRDALPVIVQ